MFGGFSPGRVPKKILPNIAVFLCARYAGGMTDEIPAPPPVKTRVGRKQKYFTPEEKREAARRNRERFKARHGQPASARRAGKMAPPDPGTPAAILAAAPVAAVPGAPLPTVIREAVAKAVVKLSVVDAAFVMGICSGLSPREALQKAKPSIKSPAYAAAKLRNSPELQAAVEQVKQALATEMAYDFRAFTQELDSASEFARRTSNATALVRAIELKGKATGHLADKPVAPSAGFHLYIAGVDAPPALTVERVDG
jgi:hypothetical protein